MLVYIPHHDDSDSADNSAEASELTLEDRITERLKSYQRQLTKMTEDREKDAVN